MGESKKHINWKILPLLKTTSDFFSNNNIPSARLDAEVLLAHVLGCERIRLYANFEKILTETELSNYRTLVKRRAGLEPVAYLIGEKEFFSRKFKVDKNVLIPRPETENLVGEAISFIRENWEKDTPLKILDLGTGSGCIATIIATNLKNAKIIATDISKEALEIAALNSATNAVDERIEFRLGSIFEPVNEELFDVIISNPPYISKDEKVMVDVADYEPSHALFADEDGYYFYKEIAVNLKKHLKENGAVFFEVGHNQAEKVIGILKANGFTKCKSIKDDAGIERIVWASLP